MVSFLTPFLEYFVEGLLGGWWDLVSTTAIETTQKKGVSDQTQKKKKIHTKHKDAKINKIRKNKRKKEKKTHTLSPTGHPKRCSKESQRKESHEKRGGKKTFSILSS